MKLGILAVGHKLPDWVAAGCDEYQRRMPRELPLAIHEIRPEPRHGKTREQLLAAEAVRLRAALGAFPRVIVLDERGDDLSTLALAQCLRDWMQDGRDTAFIIGGADGIDESIKSAAERRIRLSSLTLPHAMARLVLCEQLYRAMSVVRNHPYHREG